MSEKEQDQNREGLPPVISMPLLSQALTYLGFEICLFPPDSDPCERCGETNKQLYFQGPTDAGRYYCADCIVEEYETNKLAEAIYAEELLIMSKDAEDLP